MRLQAGIGGGPGSVRSEQLAVDVDHAEREALLGGEIVGVPVEEGEAARHCPLARFRRPREDVDVRGVETDRARQLHVPSVA